MTTVSSGQTSTSTFRIEPRRGWRLADAGEVWRYRDLLWFLALRDVRVRYKQTALGAGWAILQPLVAMVVLHVMFGRVMGMADQVGNVPYPIFLYSGLLVWQFVATALTQSSNSLVGNANMLRKVYFPRIIPPLASMGVPLVDYLAASGVMVALMLWYGVVPEAQILWMPLILLSALIAALGLGLMLAALTVSYRDFRHIVPFLVQIWFFITPVIYPSRMASNETLKALLQLNPVAGTIEAARAAVLGQPIDFVGWGISLSVAIVILILGVIYFNRVERHFADVI